MAHIMNSLLQNSGLNRRKKGIKTIRPFMTLSKSLNNYAVEVTNRFKGLDLIDRVPEELWMEIHDIVQQTGIKTIPK